MRVFVTGATGFIGSAIVQELLGAGHRVLGLARSDLGAEQLAAAGAEVHRGSLQDLASLKRGAAAADGVIHTAFIHDFSNFAQNAQLDQRAIETMAEALAGSGKPLIVSSGVLGLPPGRPGTEDDSAVSSLPRKSEEAALAAAAQGVRAMTIRLAPSVHGDGDHGFVPAQIKVAREKGFAIYVGDGKNRWPAVHRFDAAKLYRLALEQGTPGARYHGVADTGIPVREIAETIGRRLNVPAVSKTLEEAVALIGFIGHVMAMDAPASNTLTRQRLDWHPTQPGLIQDLEHGRYFDAPGG
ncbi:MAG TPA: SDR family oxidoreductase [Polyangiaceae bacterium]|jgi:nucleoside-diphosphate-sugar epimerase